MRAAPSKATTPSRRPTSRAVSLGSSITSSRQRHFELQDMGFEHTWREKGWSDHSAVWAKLASR
jgi:hypothetical protein